MYRLVLAGIGTSDSMKVGMIIKFDILADIEDHPDVSTPRVPASSILTISNSEILNSQLSFSSSSSASKTGSSQSGSDYPYTEDHTKSYEFGIDFNLEPQSFIDLQGSSQLNLTVNIA